MVNPARDIGIGLALGLVAAGAWDAYKMDQLRKTDAFYKQYEASQVKTAIRTAAKRKKGGD